MDEQKRRQIEAELQRLINNNSQKLAERIDPSKPRAQKVRVIRRRKGQKDKRF
jgi:hypothetical protein